MQRLPDAATPWRRGPPAGLTRQLLRGGWTGPGGGSWTGLGGGRESEATASRGGHGLTRIGEGKPARWQRPSLLSNPLTSRGIFPSLFLLFFFFGI